MNGLWEFKNGIRTMQDLWVKNFNEHPDLEALGYRAKLDDGSLDHEKFTWFTNAQLKTIATDLGSGMEHLGFAPKPTKPLWQTHSPRLVAVYSGNSVPYVQLDIACALYGFTTVPIYDTLGEEATEFMFDQTQLDTMFLTVSHIQGVKTLIDNKNANSIRHLVVMDDANLTFEHRTLLNSISKQASWHTWTQVINAGKSNFILKNFFRKTELAANGKN
jgi:long-chain acyl-CoA synthetase